MTIRRRCTERSCKNGRRCLEHLRFDVMYRGKRYRMPANEFAVPRMEPGKQRPIESMEEARDWERLFIGEIKAGPRSASPREPHEQAGTELRRRRRRSSTPTWTAASNRRGFAASPSVQSRVGVLKEHLGELPLTPLEDPDDINRFKTESDYAEDVEIATVHRALETLRAAMNWGMAQTPPLFKSRRSTASASG